MSFATARGLSSEINVTPMIDMLLVLLIIFMAMKPVSPKGLEAVLPRLAELDGTRRPENPVVLQILLTSGGGITYKINQTSIGREELRERLQSVFSTRASKVLFLKADKELDFSPVAASIDVARTAGVDHVALITPELAKSR